MALTFFSVAIYGVILQYAWCNSVTQCKRPWHPSKI